MTIVLGIILALLVFFAIVLFHEAGHFLAARLTKTKVEEFGIGIPPKMWEIGTDRYGTKYTVNWLPIGGFVRLKGEDISDESSFEKDAFSTRPYLARAAIILAGVFANFVLATVIFSLLFFVGTTPVAYNSQFPTEEHSLLIPTVEEALSEGALISSGIVLTPIPGSVAERAGILSGDHVLSVDNTDIRAPKDFVSAIGSSRTNGEVDDKTGGEIQEKKAIVIERSGAIETYLVTPENGKIGAYIGYDIKGPNPNFVIKYPFAESVSAGYNEMITQSKMTFGLFGTLIKRIFSPATPTERETALNSVGGPIGVASVFVDIAKNDAGWRVILAIAGLLSVNLGVFNLLPLPALDGGRFLTATIVSILSFVKFSKERIRSLEAAIHGFGFLLLLLLSVIIAFHDVYKLF